MNSTVCVAVGNCFKQVVNDAVEAADQRTKLIYTIGLIALAGLWTNFCVENRLTTSPFLFIAGFSELMLLGNFIPFTYRWMFIPQLELLMNPLCISQKSVYLMQRTMKWAVSDLTVFKNIESNLKDYLVNKLICLGMMRGLMGLFGLMLSYDAWRLKEVDVKTSRITFGASIFLICYGVVVCLLNTNLIKIQEGFALCLKKA